MKTLLEALGAGATIVTSSNRLCRHLTWRADQARSAAGRRAWPAARIRPLQPWLESLWEQSVLSGGEAGRRLLLSDEQSMLTWQQAGHGDLPVGGPAMRLVAGAWRLMHEWHLDDAAVSRSAGTRDAINFCRLAAGYRERCAAAGWIDAAALPGLIAGDLAAGRLAVPGPVAFAGFDVRTPQHAALESALESAGTPILRLRLDFPDTRPGRLKCFDPADEAERAARWARYWLERDANAIIGVMTPEVERDGAALRRRFLDILEPGWRRGSPDTPPVNVAFWRPLAENPLTHIALVLLRAAEGWIDYRDLGQLLRTPYLGGAEAERGSRAALDLRVRQRGRQRVALDGLLPVARRDAPVFAAALEALAGIREAPAERRTPGAWAARIDELLDTLGWPGGRTLDSDEFQAVRAWRKMLGTLAGAGPVLGECGFREFRELVVSFAREQSFQPEGRMNGVQLMSPRAGVDHHFDAIWIAGASADAWPPPASANPLIALPLQAAAGIPTATPAGMRHYSEKLFTRLLHAAPRSVVSWPQHRDEELLMPSPFLRAVPDAMTSELPESRIERYRDRVQWAGEPGMLTDDPVPPLTAGEPIRGGARLLKLQSVCPARAFFEIRLGARSLPVPSFGIDALARGEILHDALETLYETLDGQDAIQRRSADELSAMIDAAAARAVRRLLGGTGGWLNRLALLEERRIARLVNELLDAERRRERFSVAGREQSFEVAIGPLTLRLRCDRLDRAGDGARLVLDYKTGAGFRATDWDPVRPVEPQLPLYAVSMPDAAAIAVVLMNHEGTKFIGVGDRDFGIAGIRAAEGWFGMPAWPQLVDAWRKALTILADEFAAGDGRIDAEQSRELEDDFAMLLRSRDTARISAGPGNE